MPISTLEVLQEAHKLIKSGDKKTAQARLLAVVKENPDNATAWWLLAHATSDPTGARNALENVLRLQPDNIKAMKIMERLKEKTDSPLTLRVQSTEEHKPEVTSSNVSITEAIIPFESESPNVTATSNLDAFIPEAIVPFAINVDECATKLSEWLGNSWITPDNLKQLTKVSAFVPTYLPFWVFDAHIEGTWRGQVGYDDEESYYDHKSRERRTRTITVWKWRSGNVDTVISNLLVPATTRISHLLLEQIRQYNLDAATVLGTGYENGVSLAEADVALADAIVKAQEIMEQHVHADCRQQVGGQLRNVHLNTEFTHRANRTLLLPVYLASYHYRDKRYQVMINGRNGNISGQRPVDWIKVWTGIGASILLSIFLFLLQRAGLISPWIWLIVTVVGVLIDIIIIWTARTYDDI